MSTTQHERILRRIKKCLSLAQSDNEHEAAAALRQARALMEKHGIDWQEARQPELSVLDKSTGKSGTCAMTEWEVRLYNMIADFFGCTLYLSNRWPVLVGVAPAPTIAQYAADTLLRQLRRNRKDALESLEFKRRRLRVGERREFNLAYSAAWICAVSEKVSDFAQGVTPEASREHEAAIGRYWSMDNIPNREFSGRTLRQSPLTTFAVHAGSTAGAQAQLHHGVNDAPAQPRIA